MVFIILSCKLIDMDKLCIAFFLPVGIIYYTYWEENE